MKRLTNPELKVIRFASEDVIATSLYYAPSAAFNAINGTSFTSDFVEFEGSMTSYDPAAGGYSVSNIYNVKAANNDDIDGLKSGGSWVVPGVGITIDMSSMAPVARQSYNAYSYEGGLYTNGVTYYDTYWQ
ncbi:MAG: hypothetical protein J5659_03255 [Clostridia bacterium]|nr:hypothetical protein [Clostridia bacterium]